VFSPLTELRNLQIFYIRTIVYEVLHTNFLDKIYSLLPHPPPELNLLNEGTSCLIL